MKAKEIMKVMKAMKAMERKVKNAAKAMKAKKGNTPIAEMDEMTRLFLAYEAVRTISHKAGWRCGGFNMVMDAPLAKHVMRKLLPDVPDFDYFNKVVYNYGSQLGPEFFTVPERSRLIEDMRARAVDVWHWILIAYVSAAKLVTSNTGTHTDGAYTNSVRLANKILRQFGQGECEPAMWANFGTRFASDTWKWNNVILSEVERTAVWRDHQAEVAEFLGRLDFV